MRTATADRVFTEVAEHAEQIQNDSAHDLSRMKIGDEWRQGDVGIIRLSDDFTTRNSSQLIQTLNPSVKLAPGNTQGIRHCLDSLDGVEMFTLGNPTPLDGPILKTSKPRSILHPEHGDAVNLPPGCYAITYQRAFAEELRAVAD